MDGKLNCSMTAENAAFTKIRHLENRVADIETDVSNVEQQVSNLDGELQNALTNLQEEVSTESIETTSLNANEAEIVNLTSTNIETANLNATTIDAETINVDNLENVNVLHGVTVDVDRTIATIGQFQETQTTTANNSVTNTEELNVSTETNLTGQVNIDGNIAFTKDNGLSKLEGNYLEIEAANIIIDNKNNAEYALYVPGINGDALFGGSVAVQDTLAAKNLTVTGQVSMKGVTLDESTELINPTIKGIKGTNELTITALVIDSEGKLVSRKISSEVEGSVASSLIATKEVRTHDLYEEWIYDENSPVYKVPVSSTAQYISYPETAEIYLTNENGNQILLNTIGYISMDTALLSVSHRDTVYICHALFDEDENFKCEVIPINSNTMEVGARFDISQYFGEVTPEEVEAADGLETFVSSKVKLQSFLLGMVLPEDTPTLCFVDTNEYLDLSTMEIKTRDTAFEAAKTYILTRSGNWLELPGALETNIIYCTNGKYLSAEDAALGVPGCEDIIGPSDDSTNRVLYYVDAPVYSSTNDTLKYIDGGVYKEVAFVDIPGYISGSEYVGTVDKDGNPISFAPLYIISGEIYQCNVYVFGGYYPREYFSTTISSVETIVIDNNKVEINGYTFYEGVWYDKVVGSTNDLINYITMPKDKDKRYKVLFLGNRVEFDTSDTSQIPTSGFSANDIYGTFDIYHPNPNGKGTHSGNYYLTLNGTPGTANRISNIINACHWHGFRTEVDILFCKEALFDASNDVGRLHINDCYLEFITDSGNATAQHKYYLGISDSNNVVYQQVLIPEALYIESPYVDLTLTKCYNVIFNGHSGSGSTAEDVRYYYSKVYFNICDRCEANINANEDIYQYGPGANFVYNDYYIEESRYIIPTLRKITSL